MKGLHAAVSMLVCAGLAACMAVSLAGCGSSAPVAAQVGERSITEEQVSAYTERFCKEMGMVDSPTQFDAYLQAQGMTEQQWREKAVLELVDKMLVEDKALELGIRADDARARKLLAKWKKRAGVDAGDDAAWESYLSWLGVKEGQALDECRYQSIEEQVVERELGYGTDRDEKLADEYIAVNLAGKVLHRYEAAELPLDKRKKAQGYLDEMRRLELDGEDFEARLAEVVAELSDSSSDGKLKDMGWDFAYDASAIDPKGKLHDADLSAGQTYRRVLAGTDKCRIVRCTERVELGEKAGLDDVESASLEALITDELVQPLWESKLAEYMKSLESAAGVQLTR